MTPRRKTETSTKPQGSRANNTLNLTFPHTRCLRRNSSQRVQKSENQRRTSARLRGKYLNTTPSLSLPQKASNGCEEQVGPRQQKRRRDSEEELDLSTGKAPPTKRARNTASATFNHPQPLNAKTLKRHTLDKGYVDVLDRMGLGSDNSRKSRGSKRSASRVGIGNGSSASTSMGEQDTASQVTQRSSFTNAHYRLTILAGANIIFRFKPAPLDVNTKVTTIIQRPISEERKEELSRIAHTIHEKFASILEEAVREDCIELFHEALSSLGYSDSIILRRKADWEPSLKPRRLPPALDLGFLIPPQNEVEDSGRPSKRQHGERIYPSPEISGAGVTDDLNSQDKSSGPEQTRPPPVPERMGPPLTSQWDVKTPRPDISVGLSNDAIINALHLLDLTKKDAKDILKALAAPDPRNGGKPLLCLESTKQNIQVRFPFMPVEGKSYATGKTLYEAQNQAAVSGACALEILHRLDDLVQTADPNSQSKGQHIVFSICTEGPTHEIWAHYTTEEDGDRIYNNKIWKSSNLAIASEVLGFLEAVDNVMKWGIEEHLELIVNQLKLLWTAAQPHS